MPGTEFQSKNLRIVYLYVWFLLIWIRLAHHCYCVISIPILTGYVILKPKIRWSNHPQILMFTSQTTICSMISIGFCCLRISSWTFSSTWAPLKDRSPTTSRACRVCRDPQRLGAGESNWMSLGPKSYEWSFGFIWYCDGWRASYQAVVFLSKLGGNHSTWRGWWLKNVPKYHPIHPQGRPVAGKIEAASGTGSGVHCVRRPCQAGVEGSTDAADGGKYEEFEMVTPLKMWKSSVTRKGQ